MVVNNRPNWSQRKNIPKREILKKNLSLTEQVYSIQAYYPQFELKFSSLDKIQMIGTLQPSPLSSLYTIKLEYELEGVPKIWVVSPELKQYENQPIPHMYNQKTLCLYYPKAKEWKKTMWISKTILPWACLWLQYYEMWLVTGIWYGGGIEHT